MRQVLAVVVLVVVLACGGSSPPAPPPPAVPLTLSCGTYNAGSSVGLVLAAVFDPAPSTAITFAIDGVAGPRQVTCPAGLRLCLHAMAEVAAWPEDGGPAFQASVSVDLGSGVQKHGCQAPPTLLPQPSGSALLSGGQVTATWSPVAGAVAYRAQLRDLGPPGVAPASVLGQVTTTATQATFTLAGPSPELAVVEVEAWAIDPAMPLAGALPVGAANRSMRAFPFGTAPWTLKQPSDFSAGTLTLEVPAGSRLAVTLLNTGSADVLEGAPASIAASGTAASARQVRALLPGASQGAAGGRVHPLLEAPQRNFAAWAGLGAQAPSATVAPPATTTFCTPKFTSAGYFIGNVRRAATLVRETGTGLLYVDDANAGEFAPGDWDALAATWEESQAFVVGHTGPPSDIDGNGKVILFFTSQMGAQYGGFTTELGAPLDVTPGCSGTGSNHAEIFHIHSPVGVSSGPGTFISPADMVSLMPTLFSHEFQHLVDLVHFASRAGGYWGEGWLMEGRAELASNLTGSGMNVALHRSFRSEFFSRLSASGAYQTLRLLPWEPKNINYAASSLFLQYLADRLGPNFETAFFQEGNTLAQLEATSGLPFPVAYGLWTSALLFSNEPANPWPVLDYTGAGWTPLHQKLQRLDYAPLDVGAATSLTLRKNGFDVYVTGPAGAGGGTVTVTSGAAVKPYVVAVPFTGTLP